MTALLRVFFADLRRRPGTALASVLAIAAGVAIFVAIFISGGAARSSFVSAVEALSGRATHEVTALGGLAPERLAELAALPAVRAAQPVVEDFVAVRALRRGSKTTHAVTIHEGLPPLRLLGVDPFFVRPFFRTSSEDGLVASKQITDFITQRGAAILPKPWADAAGAGVGDRLEVAASGRIETLRVIAIYDLDVLGEAARDTAVVDIATAQEILARDELDRIELILTDESGVRQALRPGERLQRPSERGERVARMVDAFRLNLLALGSLALLVGSLLVFNACQFLVVRRRALLGQLRCLGASRRMVTGAILTEVALFGVVGGGLGILGGVLLSRGLVGSVAQTVTDLYSFVRVESTPLRPVWAAAIFLGTVALAVTAGFFPARDAARTPPRQVGLRSREEVFFRSNFPRLLALAAAGVAAGLLVLRFDWNGWLVGLASAAAFLVAGACLLPVGMALVLPRMQRYAESRGHFAWSVGSGSVFRSLSRTGGAASALGVALAMTIGVVVMINSFEAGVKRWIETSLRADVYIADPTEKVSRQTARIPQAVVDELAALSAVRAVDTLRGIEVPFAESSIFVCGVEIHDRSDDTRFEILEGSSDALEGIARGEMMISEPLSRHHDLHPGDTLVLNAHDRQVSFPVAGVFRDFSYDRGYAFTSKERFVEAFGDPGVRNVALFLKSGHDPEGLAEELRARFADGFVLSIRSNARLRSDILDVFDRTFAVTYLLQVIATVLALAGIGVTLFGLFLERAREISTLRSLGATMGQVARIFAAESLLMAAFPVALSLPLGYVLAWILIDVVNLRSFGWTFDMQWPWGPVLFTASLAALAGLSATIVPLTLVRRQSIAKSLREE